jgi:hypothetical protein
MTTEDTLSADERALIGRCLRAAVEGPFFDEAEFPTLIGVTRTEARRLAFAWPTVSHTDETVASAVNNMLLNLFGYPHGDEAAWAQLIGVSQSEIRGVWAKWRASTSLPPVSRE